MYIIYYKNIDRKKTRDEKERKREREKGLKGKI